MIRLCKDVRTTVKRHWDLFLINRRAFSFSENSYDKKGENRQFCLFLPVFLSDRVGYMKLKQGERRRRRWLKSWSVCLSVGLFVNLSFCLSICLSLSLSVCLSVSFYFLFLSLCLSLIPSLCLSIRPRQRTRTCLSSCLSFCLSVRLGRRSVCREKWVTEKRRRIGIGTIKERKWRLKNGRDSRNLDFSAFSR